MRSRVALLALALSSCTAPRPPVSLASAALAANLHARAPDMPEAHVRDLLAETFGADGWRCAPPADAVLAPPPAFAAHRAVRGSLLHYGIYPGPMRYRVKAGRLRSGAPVWRVLLNIAVEPSGFGGTMELSDCALRPALEGPVHCSGTPYEDAPELEACPGSGHFEARASRSNFRALLSRWSREVEAHYNRDARRYRLPVRYDFELFLADEPPRATPVDLRMPLWLSCGRTPYFLALRSGWSVSVVAHELGHYLGLVDEYEPLSGVLPFYPKSPYPGSSSSRMGISMKRHTRFLPLHHYLVLRRYHCGAPTGEGYPP